MEQIIKDLFPMNRCLLGEGYDNSLEYLKHLLPLDIISIPSGTKLETWTVPDEWIIKDAWIKYKGKKILDYKENPMCLTIGSAPFHGEVDLEELKKHLIVSDELPNEIPYSYRFYEKDWSFGIPKNVALKKKGNFWKKLGDICDECKDYGDGKISVRINGIKTDATKFRDALPKGKYEVMVDTEFRPGNLKIGVHTIKGQSDREILLLAHLDHPFQANDNLSGVACLVDIANKLKCEHTVKIIFCPETIGSIAYAMTQDISKVDFVISVDVCGNNNTILLQKSFDNYNRLNRVAHCAMQSLGRPYRKGSFRNVIGSDEYVFNDPKIGIPGLLLTRFPYKEYHTTADTPETINYDMIKETQDVILKIIEIYEKDYMPFRAFKAPLMRSKFGIQSFNQQINLNYDYLIYHIDGEKYLSELCSELEFSFDMIYEVFEKLKKSGVIACVRDTSEREIYKTP